MTTAGANQTTGLTNGTAANWAPEVELVKSCSILILEFSPYRALSRRSLLGDENGSCIFVSLAAWLSFPHAKLTAGGEGRVRNLAIECVSFFSFFPLILPTVLAFFHDQTDTLTQTRKARRQAERPKGDREQFTSLDFWITD